MKKINLLSAMIKGVRDSGKTNMFDKNAVQYYAFHLGMFELVSFIEDEKENRFHSRYVDLLAYTDYIENPEIEGIKEMADEYDFETEEKMLEIRQELLYQLGDLFEEYKSEKELFEFEEIGVSLKNIEEAGKKVIDYIKEDLDKHMINYLLPLTSKNEIYVLLKGGVYNLSRSKLLDLEELEALLEENPIRNEYNHILGDIMKHYNLKKALKSGEE